MPDLRQGEGGLGPDLNVVSAVAVVAPVLGARKGRDLKTEDAVSQILNPKVGIANFLPESVCDLTKHAARTFFGSAMGHKSEPAQDGMGCLSLPLHRLMISFLRVSVCHASFRVANTG